MKCRYLVELSVPPLEIDTGDVTKQVVACVGDVCQFHEGYCYISAYCYQCDIEAAI